MINVSYNKYIYIFIIFFLSTITHSEQGPCGQPLWVEGSATCLGLLKTLFFDEANPRLHRSRETNLTGLSTWQTVAGYKSLTIKCT